MAMDLNAQGFGHMFPYANIHELNLDWLIAKVKELEERVTDLERRMAEAEARLDDHEARITWLEAELARLREEWEAFKAYIEDRFDQLEAEIRELFAALEARIDAKFEQLKHQLEDRFTALESELKTQVQEILQYIIDTCAEFTDKVTRLTVRVENLEAGMEECCLTISGKLDEVLAALDEVNPELRELVVTQNGTYLASDEGASGYYKVVVNVEGGGGAQAVLEAITKAYTSNGTYTITPEQGVDGFNTVTITVNVPENTFSTQEKSVTVTSNGTQEVTPDAGKDGLSKVTITTNVHQRTPQPLNIDPAWGQTVIDADADTYFDPVTVTLQELALMEDVTANGSYTFKDTNNKPLKQVKVNVNVPQTTVQALTDSVTAGTSAKQYTKTAPSGQAYSPVNLTVNPTPTEEKTVTQNGVVTPSSGKHLSKVTVAVPSGFKVLDILPPNSMNPVYQQLSGVDTYAITAGSGGKDFTGLSNEYMSGGNMGTFTVPSDFDASKTVRLFVPAFLISFNFSEVPNNLYVPPGSGIILTDVRFDLFFYTGNDSKWQTGSQNYTNEKSYYSVSELSLRRYFPYFCTDCMCELNSDIKNYLASKKGQTVSLGVQIYKCRLEWSGIQNYSGMKLYAISAVKGLSPVGVLLY